MLLSSFGVTEKLPELSQPYVSIESRETRSLVIQDARLCKKILASDKFHEYKYSEIFRQILGSFKSDSQGLVRFFANSPLEQDAGGTRHDSMRSAYKALYDRVAGYEPEHPVLSETLTTDRYVDLYMDAFLRKAFKGILGSDTCYSVICSSRGMDIFDIFANPSRILAISRSIDSFYESYPSDSASVDSDVREYPEAFLTLLLMGRDPLSITLTCWLNSIVSGDDPESVNFRTVSPTNFVPRICSESMTIDGVGFEKGEVAYLLLAAANNSQHMKSRIGLAFGYGAHFCLGYRFADRVMEKFKSSFDYRNTDYIQPTRRVIKNAFSDFVQEE